MNHDSSNSTTPPTFVVDKPLLADLKDGGLLIWKGMAKRRNRIAYAPKSRRKSSGADRNQSASSSSLGSSSSDKAQVTSSNVQEINEKPERNKVNKRRADDSASFNLNPSHQQQPKVWNFKFINLVAMRYPDPAGLIQSTLRFLSSFFLPQSFVQFWVLTAQFCLRRKRKENLWLIIIITAFIHPWQCL